METNPVGFRERRRSGEQGEGGEGGWHIPGGMAAPGSQLLPKVLPQAPAPSADRGAPLGSAGSPAHKRLAVCAFVKRLSRRSLAALSPFLQKGRVFYCCYTNRFPCQFLPFQATERSLAWLPLD